MAYREIPIATKVEAVLDHIRGLRPSEIERKHQVDRDSLRLWVKKATAAVMAALTPNPGRPSGGCAEKFNTESQQSQKPDAAGQDQALIPGRAAASGQCPLCGGSHLARNGWYTTGGKRIPLARVQRLVCRDCGANLYQSKKNSSGARPAPGLPKRRRKPPAGQADWSPSLP